MWTDLPRLRAIGVVLPVAFIVGIELIRCIVVEGDLASYADHIALAVVTVLSVIAFAAVMFYFIERAQRQVVRQNRELAAANAVSTAVQGELGVDQIIDAALESVVASSGATEASVTVFAPEGHPPNEGGMQRRFVAPRPTSSHPGPGPAAPHLIDIPLSTGASVVGRLRLHMPEEADRPNLLTSSTLQNIGHQLACSIQIGQLVADLRRRQREGHGLYAVLLQISNQKALADTLATVVRYARDLLASDEANLWLNDPASRSVQLDGALWGAVALDDGTVRIFPQSDRLHDLDGHRLVRPVRPSPEFRESLAVPIRSPAGTLGDLWIGRRSETPFTERDRRYLVTLSDLASIAITSARMRENERLGAMLAERERIAREMHDGLAQVLGATHLRLRALGSRPEVRATHAITAELDELADLSQEAYRDVREAILGLRESSRTDRGLLDSLRAYLDKYSRQCGIETSLETTLDRELVLAPRSELQVIRVIQEALTNVRKHSGASLVIVRLSESDHTATFVVEDDGRGFDLAGALLGRDGFGLHTMRERMELIGGTLQIDSGPGRGTRVIAGCPWHSRLTSTPLEVDIARS
jgi:two-component system nitrate/nitrite sensor histidine kinase NarX